MLKATEIATLGMSRPVHLFHISLPSFLPKQRNVGSDWISPVSSIAAAAAEKSEIEGEIELLLPKAERERARERELKWAIVGSSDFCTFFVDVAVAVILSG